MSGTLAADSLSLRPFIANRAPALAHDGQWSRDAFDLDWENFADVDLRVSAARLSLPGGELEDAAFSVLNQKDRLEIALIEAKAYSGDLKGRASFAKTAAGLEMRASGAVLGRRYRGGVAEFDRILARRGRIVRLGQCRERRRQHERTDAQPQRPRAGRA